MSYLKTTVYTQVPFSLISYCTYTEHHSAVFGLFSLLRLLDWIIDSSMEEP